MEKGSRGVCVCWGGDLKLLQKCSLVCISIYRLIMFFFWSESPLSSARQRDGQRQNENRRGETCAVGWRRTRPDARRLLLLNSTMSGWSLFNTYQNNKLNSFCPLGHYIIRNPRSLCDNRLIAWLAWRKALLAEFLYRYAVWQHNILRERWGCWIRVMQTDRVSWNMKPGRSNLSENTQGKKKKREREILSERVWGWVSWGGRGGGGGVQRRWETETEMRAQKTWRGGNARRYGECKPEKRKETERCFLRGGSLE